MGNEILTENTQQATVLIEAKILFDRSLNPSRNTSWGHAGREGTAGPLAAEPSSSVPRARRREARAKEEKHLARLFQQKYFPDGRRPERPVERPGSWRPPWAREGQLRICY